MKHDTAQDGNKDSRFYCIFNNLALSLKVNLLLPLVNFTQKGLQHGLDCFARMSFNGGYKLLIALGLVLLEYTLLISIISK